MLVVPIRRKEKGYQAISQDAMKGEDGIQNSTGLSTSGRVWTDLSRGWNQIRKAKLKQKWKSRSIVPLRGWDRRERQALRRAALFPPYGSYVAPQAGPHGKSAFQKPGKRLNLLLIHTISGRTLCLSMIENNPFWLFCLWWQNFSRPSPSLKSIGILRFSGVFRGSVVVYDCLIVVADFLLEEYSILFNIVCTLSLASEDGFFFSPSKSCFRNWISSSLLFALAHYSCSALSE